MAQAFADGGTAPPVPRSGRYRWLIVGVLFAATTVNYIDRTMLGLLAPTLGTELGWSENDYGNIVTAFQAAYALGFLLMGWLIDRFGPKIGYSIAISIWTIGHIAHGFAGSVASFMAARVILGVGEAGHFPSVVRASSEWFPQKERSYAIGWVNSATTIGVILTAPTIWLFMVWMGFDWRQTFIYTGAFGVVLLLLWLLLYSNPRESGKVSDAELAWIEHDPPEKIERLGWRAIVTKREAWAYATGKFLTDPVWFLMLFWPPKYFSTTYDVDLKVVLLPMIIMYLLSDVGSILGGWVSSKLIQTGHSVNFARKATMLGAGCCVLPLLFVSGLDNMWLAVVLIGIALAGHQAFSSTILSIPPDMFPKRAVGSVIGLGGFAGGVGGMIMAKSTGLVLDATGGSYTLIFAACTTVYFLAVLAIHLLSPRLAPVTVESKLDPMPRPLALSPDRLFPSDPAQRDIARRLYKEVAGLPIISPHGHTDPSWFAGNQSFGDATEMLLHPDHYVFRMLYSQGVSLDALGIRNPGADPRESWRLFAQNYHLFRGTPSRMWMDWVFAEAFGFDVQFSAETSDLYYDRITAALATDAFRPRALFDRFGIEVIATTESPLDTLEHHAVIRAANESGEWGGRVITAYRPDPVVDPEFEGFRDNLKRFSDLAGEDAFSYAGYLAAHRNRRAFFAEMGATSTDHGHPTAATADLSDADAEALFSRVTRADVGAAEAELFRAHMLTVMAGMSLDDGLVMQIHPGAFRNHNPWLFEHYGRDKGADIPMSTDYVHALRPLLARYGNEVALTIILFTLDETSYARELAPLAGHYPALKLGPAWWFHDSPEGMRRFRSQMTETAGFYNSVGFNDDTRAFLSIPARHDVARRIDCGFLAQLVAEHRMEEGEAAELATDLSYNLAKAAYKL